jgi:dTDP-L-rhamnose 4-epimerase
VTGGAGFIGHHLVKALLNQGHYVRVLDNLLEQVHGPSPQIPTELDGAEFMFGDVCNASDLEAALVDVEAIVHLASHTGVGQSMYEVYRYVEANIEGTTKLLQVLIDAKKPIKRFVLASSRAVYGEGLYLCDKCDEVTPSGREAGDLAQSKWEPLCPLCGGMISPIPTHENAQLDPQSVYAITKLTQEHLCHTIGKAYGIPVVILRYFNVYGPGQSLLNPYTGILSTIHMRIGSGDKIEVFEDGLESRDFIYIDDVVTATLGALSTPQESLQHNVFNVGTGVSVSIADLARIIVDVSAKDIPIHCSGAYRVGDIRHAFADTKRSMEELGFRAKTTIEVGIRKWMLWASEQIHHNLADVAQQELLEHKLYRRGE